MSTRYIKGERFQLRRVRSIALPSPLIVDNGHLCGTCGLPCDCAEEPCADCYQCLEDRAALAAVSPAKE